MRRTRLNILFSSLFLIILLLIILKVKPDVPGKETTRFRRRLKSSQYIINTKTSYWNFDKLVNSILSHPYCNEGNVLTIMIPSAAGNAVLRNEIRKTWCSQRWVAKILPTEIQSWQCIFLVGLSMENEVKKQVADEVEQFKDILLVDFPDSYRNLSFKVITGLHWIDKHCLSSFILKTDDDCFINTIVLLQLIRLHELEQMLYLGRVILEPDKTKVIRDNSSRWAVSRQQYEADFYPFYASGMGYLLSSDTVSLILKQSILYEPFPNEDAYIGVLVNSAGLKPRHSNRFSQFKDWKLCNFLYFVVMHNVYPLEQAKYMQMSSDAQYKCVNQKFIASL